jgi:uncharacterized protein (DUF849 family)
MSRSVIITCAVTGGADTTGKSPYVPITPEQIANSGLEAAKAGAAVLHIHVRDPQTGKVSVDLALFREVVERIRSSGSDVIVNLTTGDGGVVSFDGRALGPGGLGTVVMDPEERITHVMELRPEMCTLDMGTVNFSDKHMINKPPDISKMAKAIREAGVRPELEVFDVGNIGHVQHLIRNGELDAPALFQLCFGIPWGAPATPETMILMRNLLPPGSLWAAFGISFHEFPILAQAVLLGGQVRVGLEDNIYIEHGVLARSNAVLVEKAVKIVTSLGENVATPADARTILGLKTTSSRSAMLV